MFIKFFFYLSFVCLIKLFYKYRYYLFDDNKKNVWSSEFMIVDILFIVINGIVNCKYLWLGFLGGVSNI